MAKCDCMFPEDCDPKTCPHETAHHELLQDTVAQDHSVTCEIGTRSPCIFRGKQNFRSQFLRDVIADHRFETHQTADLAKVDLLDSFLSNAGGSYGQLEGEFVRDQDARLLRALAEIGAGRTRKVQIQLGHQELSKAVRERPNEGEGYGEVHSEARRRAGRQGAREGLGTRLSKTPRHDLARH